MADYKVTDTELTSIANAIRAKGETQAQLEFPSGFVSAVQSLVPVFSAQDEGKVVSNGALVAQGSQIVTENGTYDTTLKNEVVVNVQSAQDYGQNLMVLSRYTKRSNPGSFNVTLDSTTNSIVINGSSTTYQNTAWEIPEDALKIFDGCKLRVEPPESGGNNLGFFIANGETIYAIVHYNAPNSPISDVATIDSKGNTGNGLFIIIAYANQSYNNVRFPVRVTGV